MTKKFKIRILLPIILMSGIIIVSSCSDGSGTTTNKKDELKKLKSKLSELQTKIAQLESEIEAEEGNGTRDMVPVDALKLEPSTFERKISVQGIVESDKVSTLSCQIGGPVVAINVSEGMMVSKGQLLMQIDNSTLIKSLEEMKTRLEFAEDMYRRQERLWNQKAGSEVQYLQAKNTYESLQKSISTLEKQIDNAKIYAPFSGYVDYVFPKVGETVMPGMPAVKLTDMSNIKLVANVSESYITTVKPGVTVEIAIPDNEEKVQGKIINSGRSIDVKNRTFRVEIKSNKSIPNLRPYQVCGISITDVTKPNALVVPIAYIQRSDNEVFVYVINSNDGTVSKRIIEQGLSNESNAEVISGLSAGEMIVTNGVLDVTDGQKVKIVSMK